MNVITSKNLGNREPNRRHFTIPQSYAYVAGTVVIRDWPDAPLTTRGRITFFSILFFGTLVYYHWEAMIISYLAVRTITLPFASLEELVKDTDFKATFCLLTL